MRFRFWMMIASLAIEIILAGLVAFTAGAEAHAGLCRPAGDGGGVDCRRGAAGSGGIVAAPGNPGPSAISAWTPVQGADTLLPKERGAWR